MHLRVRRRARSDRGQSVVEFALVLPLILILVVAIADLARVYTTMINVESAAREAADYGSFGSQKWNTAVYSVVPGGTEAQMKYRACVAASKLPDYIGPDDNCTNPTFTYDLSGDKGATWHPFDSTMTCDDAVRNPPCWVRVTLRYDFNLFVPLHVNMLGVQFGLPDDLTIERSATFPMTDLDLP